MDNLIFFMFNIGLPILGILIVLYFIKANNNYFKKKNTGEEIPWKVKFHRYFSLELLIIAILFVIGLGVYIYCAPMAY